MRKALINLNTTSKSEHKMHQKYQMTMKSVITLKKLQKKQ